MAPAFVMFAAPEGMSCPRIHREGDSCILLWARCARVSIEGADLYDCPPSAEEAYRGNRAVCIGGDPSADVGQLLGYGVQTLHDAFALLGLGGTMPIDVVRQLSGVDPRSATHSV